MKNDHKISSPDRAALTLGSARIVSPRLVLRFFHLFADYFQIITRSSTAEIMTTALSPDRAFFILLTTWSVSSAFTTVATIFLVLYATSTVVLPLPDATL